jgi:hypothetical protein
MVNSSFPPGRALQKNAFPGMKTTLTAALMFPKLSAKIQVAHAH